MHAVFMPLSVGLLVLFHLPPVVWSLPATSSPRQVPGGFISSGGCSLDWALGFGGYPQFVAAECPDKATGTKHASFISLMDCAANSEGVLEGKKAGSALLSCGACSRLGPSSITCLCMRTWGPPVNSTLDLDTVIRNENGVLACFDYLGIEVKSMNDPPA